MKEERKGELYILAEAVLWSLFPVVTVLSFSGFAPVVSLLWTTGLAALFFVIVMLYRGTWKELGSVELWKHAAMITLFIGVGFYGLYFWGLQYTSAGNAAIIALFEVLTAYVFFNIIRREPFPLEHRLGALFMLLGGVIVLGRGFSGVAFGDLILLAAMFLGPVGNFFQQKAREIASSETIMFLRSALSLPAFFVFAIFTGADLSVGNAFDIWPVLLVNGILIFGLSKLFWIEGIHRMTVTKAILLQSVTPFLTLLFAWWLLSEPPTLWQVLSLAPFMIGIVLLTGHFRLHTRPEPPLPIAHR